MNTPFVGTGHNPEGPDLPLGLGMLLAEDPQAMRTFAGMSAAQKQALIGYVQGGASGGEAMVRISKAMQRLRGGKTHF